MAETYNASTDTNKSPLEKLSKQFLNTELSRNQYSYNNGYGINHPNAISDGDNKGKGQNESGEVGSKVDILTRTETLARNRYTNNNGYGISHPNAISDGDEKGKGQNESGQVGSASDILNRNETLARNKFQENKRYPDF